MTRKFILAAAFLVLSLGFANQGYALNGYETVCQVRVDREIADVYLQEAGVFRRKLANGKWETLLGMKVYDVFKSCFILSPRANLGMTVTSSSGGHATAAIGYNPSEHLKGSWVYRRFDNFYLKDCGSRIQYHMQSYCK